MNKKYKLVTLVVVSVINFHCFSSGSLFKSAKPVGVNGSNMSMFMGGSYSSLNGSGLISLDIGGQMAVLPGILDAGIRGYIGFPLDSGMVNSLGVFPMGAGFGAGVKYIPLAGEFFSMAFALESAVNIPTMYMSFYPTALFTFGGPDFSLTLAPKIIIHSASLFNDSVDFSMKYGASVSLDIGNKAGIVPEFGIYFPLLNEGAQGEFTWYAGMSFRLDDRGFNFKIPRSGKKGKNGGDSGKPGGEPVI